MWERYSYRDAQAWRWLYEFTVGKTILFFPSDLESNLFEIEQGKEITGTLENSFAFEFFLTDYELTYLLFYDHHDYLGAYGAAIDWLKAKVVEIHKKY